MGRGTDRDSARQGSEERQVTLPCPIIDITPPSPPLNLRGGRGGVKRGLETDE